MSARRVVADLRSARPPAKPNPQRRAKPATRSRAADVLDESLVFKLVQVVNLTARPFHDGIGRQHRLSLSDWRVMTVVGSHPGISASDVCVRSGMDKMSVSRAIVSLARARRMLRKPDPDDGRRTLLQLSLTGQRLFDTMAVGARQRERQLFGRVSAADMARLSSILDRLVEGLLAADTATD